MQGGTADCGIGKQCTVFVLDKVYFVRGVFLFSGGNYYDHIGKTMAALTRNFLLKKGQSEEEICRYPFVATATPPLLYEGEA